MKLFRKTALARALLILTAAEAFAAAGITAANGPYLSGSAPSGFGSQPIWQYCQNTASPTSGDCGPLVMLYDPVSGNIATIGSGGLAVANPSVGSTGSAAPGSAALIGGRAQSAAPSPTSNGNMSAFAMGLEGKLINLPYANKENMLRGAASQTGTSATTLIAAQGAGAKIYITGVQCSNTTGVPASPTASPYVMLNDTASTILVVPPSGGNDPTFPVPLVVAANTALTFTPSTATTTLYCNAQGYSGI
jgi:hypothetical protein